MNNRHLLSLLQKNNYRTVEVQFSGLGKQYTYKALYEDEIKAGDRVVVDFDGMKVVTVIEVRANAKIDVNRLSTYKWVVCKIDITRYSDLIQQQKLFDLGMRNVELAGQQERYELEVHDSLDLGPGSHAQSTIGLPQ